MSTSDLSYCPYALGPSLPHAYEAHVPAVVTPPQAVLSKGLHHSHALTFTGYVPSISPSKSPPLALACQHLSCSTPHMPDWAYVTDQCLCRAYLDEAQQ